MLRQMQQEEQPDLIIGTSMGGMYTEMLNGTDRILVNPAFQMGETMGKHGMIGKQTFQNPRKDGVQEFIVTKAMVKEYEEMTSHCFAHAADEGEQQRVYGLFGDEDPLVHTFPMFSEHYANAIRFHGEHRLSDKVAHHYLMPVIRWIDDRQEGRERPIVFIDFNALHDSYDNPTASMHKAYEMLIERYDVSGPEQHTQCPCRCSGLGREKSQCPSLEPHSLCQPTAVSLWRLLHFRHRHPCVHGHIHKVGQR